jgi:PAS domain-containing protein
MVFDHMLAVSLLVTGFFSAFLGLLLLTFLQKKNQRGQNSVFQEASGNAEYLFDNKVLIDATPVARSLLPKACQDKSSAWPGLVGYLEQKFPGVTGKLETLATQGALTMGSAEDDSNPPMMLRAELRGGLTRISVIETELSGPKAALDPLTRRAIREELEQLRQISAKAPLPIWRESDSGDVVWANASYLDLATQSLTEDQDLTWPLPKLFAQRTDQEPMMEARRTFSAKEGAAPQWFDLYEFQQEGERQFYALPADKTVKAEEGLRSFMQTLTKTFAHLSTGLAIFDHDRKLVLFNPALLDLTGLPPDFLIKRPSLPSFFDALRDASMIPEPRNYKSWRNRITDIEKAAASGLYEETWTLSSGQTYEVTGRPHPNGALALSFEDISDEMTQTRRYRADLELGQSVIDAVDTAIAVFSAAGVLVMSNAAYSDLWKHDPAATLGPEGNLAAMCNHWRAVSAPTTIWDRAEDFAGGFGARDAWQEEVRLADGRRLTCRFSPLADGATMATFQLEAADSNGADLTFSTQRKLAG